VGELCDATVTWDQVLFRAANMFATKGYCETSFSDIARAVETTEVVLKSVFLSKDEVAHALVGVCRATLRDITDTVVAEKLPSIESVVKITASFAREFADSPVLQAGVFLYPKIVPSDLLVDVGNDWPRVIDHFFTRGIEEGDLEANIDVSMLSNVLTSKYHGAQLFSSVSCGCPDLMQKVLDMWTSVITRWGTPNTVQLRAARVFWGYASSWSSEACL
jgi:AcrR family transcriptional regulator